MHLESPREPEKKPEAGLRVVRAVGRWWHTGDGNGWLKGIPDFEIVRKVKLKL